VRTTFPGCDFWTIISEAAPSISRPLAKLRPPFKLRSSWSSYKSLKDKVKPVRRDLRRQRSIFAVPESVVLRRLAPIVCREE
jgi:hypothetical protein